LEQIKIGCYKEYKAFGPSLIYNTTLDPLSQVKFDGSGSTSILEAGLGLPANKFLTAACCPRRDFYTPPSPPPLENATDKKIVICTANSKKQKQLALVIAFSTHYHTFSSFLNF
jgi:hypothetical protein